MPSRWRIATALAALCVSAAPAAAAVEAIPLVGVGRPTGRGGDSFDFGLGLGVSIGGRVADRVSLHGQFHFHWLNFNDGESFGGLSGRLVVASAAPLFHLLPRGAHTDVMVGPTVGFYYLAESADFGTSFTANTRGLHFGLMFAALFRVGQTTSLGPYLTYQRLIADRLCVTDRGSSGSVCDDHPDDEPQAFLALGLAIGF